MSSLAQVQQLDSFLYLYKQHIIQLMEWVSVSCDDWTCYSPEILQLDVIATHSGTTYLVVIKRKKKSNNLHSLQTHCVL